MKNMSMLSPFAFTLSDGFVSARQRIFEANARRREERSRQVTQSALTSPSYGLARAVVAVVERLPTTGAVAMDWTDVLRLVHLDEPSEETLRELQEALRAKHVLAAFGSRTVVFARDPE